MVTERKQRLQVNKIQEVKAVRHRIIAGAVSAVMSAVICLSAMDARCDRVLADSVSDLEAEISANQAAIEEKRREMQELEAQSSSAKEYIEALSEKMELQQQNIDLINGQIEDLEADIRERQEDITELEAVIAEQKSEIDVNIEAFRERLRSMYISGSDSMAEVLTGATDFYDLLARTELINRIAKYDDDMINELNNQLDEYNAQNDELNNQKAELEIRQQNAVEKRDILQGEMNGLIEEYDASNLTLESLKADAQLAQSDIDWLDSQNAALQDKIDDIKEQERIAAEKARKEAEERERKRQEKLRRQQELEQQQNSGGPSEVTVDYSKEVFSGNRSDIVDYAKTYLGVYYQWCGNYPAAGYYGLDCSHFTYRVLEHFGLMDYYMDSRGQCRYCTPISESELQPGDLVFYYNSGGTVEHVTMYIGSGQIIGCQGGGSSTTTQAAAEAANAKVKIVSLYSDSRYKTFGRVPGMD